MTVNTTKLLPTLEFEQPSISQKQTFEDLVKINNKNYEKPKKKRKTVQTFEIITTTKYLEMKVNEEKEKEKSLLEKEKKRFCSAFIRFAVG